MKPVEPFPAFRSFFRVFRLFRVCRRLFSFAKTTIAGGAIRNSGDVRRTLERPLEKKKLLRICERFYVEQLGEAEAVADQCASRAAQSDDRLRVFRSVIALTSTATLVGQRVASTMRVSHLRSTTRAVCSPDES